MDDLPDYLKHLAGQFTGLSDPERLDQAADMAGKLRKLTDLLVTGELDASAESQASFSGAVWVLEAITDGRTTDGDAGRTDETEGER